MSQLQMIFKMNTILANIEGLNPFRLLDLAFFVLVIDFACIFLTFPILKLFEIFFVYNAQKVLKIVTFVEIIVGICVCAVFFVAVMLIA